MRNLHHDVLRSTCTGKTSVLGFVRMYYVLSILISISSASPLIRRNGKSQASHDLSVIVPVLKLTPSISKVLNA